MNALASVLQIIQMSAKPFFLADSHPYWRALLPLRLNGQMHGFGLIQQMFFKQGLKNRQQAIFLFETRGQGDTVPRQRRCGHHRPYFFVARAHRLRWQEGGGGIGTQWGAQWQCENLGCHGLANCRSESWLAGGSIPAIF